MSEALSTTPEKQIDIAAQEAFVAAMEGVAMPEVDPNDLEVTKPSFFSERFSKLSNAYKGVKSVLGAASGVARESLSISVDGYTLSPFENLATRVNGVYLMLAMPKDKDPFSIYDNRMAMRALERQNRVPLNYQPELSKLESAAAFAYELATMSPIRLMGVAALELVAEAAWEVQSIKDPSGESKTSRKVQHLHDYVSRKNTIHEERLYNPVIRRSRNYTTEDMKRYQLGDRRNDWGGRIILR